MTPKKFRNILDHEPDDEIVGSVSFRIMPLFINLWEATGSLMSDARDDVAHLVLSGIVDDRLTALAAFKEEL